MPSFDIVNECFKYNGEYYSFKTLAILAQKLSASKEPYIKDIGIFFKAWCDSSPIIELKTSGSTGVPKIIKMKKQAMVNSAIATGTHFNLQPSNKALLCLPAHYIAGKMMLVRALVLGLEIDTIEPKSNLNIDLDKHYHFTAMVPLQIEKSLTKLNNIDNVIVGGAKVSKALMERFQSINTTVFETYGMTETVSHIAVKQLNNQEINIDTFKILPGIKITKDERDCLVVNAPNVSENTIITNDIVKLHSNTEFEWIGRADNVINSGGIKVFPEQVENKLSGKIDRRFFIASEKDEVFGERVILLIEGTEIQMDDTVFQEIDSFSKPKHIYFISEFIETSSGKIQRNETVKLIERA